MRTILTSGISAAAMFFVVSSPAQAQSTPSSPFNGAYIGVNGGFVQGDTRFDRTTGDQANNQAALDNNLRPTRYTIEDEGFTLGGQIGYSRMLGEGSTGIVAGIEADLAYTDLDQTDTFDNTTFLGGGVVPSPTAVTRINQYAGELKYLGTLRARLGYAMGNGMIYGTGGLAMGKVRQSATFFGPNAPTTPFFFGERTDTQMGYAAGGGVEMAMPGSSGTGRMTFRVEALHYDLGHKDFRMNSVGPAAALGLGGYDARVRTSGNLVRAGVNYRF